MKKYGIILSGFLIALSFSTISLAQEQKIIVTGSRFVYPLLEKWIAEYTKINPGAQIRINPRGGVNADSANLIINAHELSPEEIRPGYKVVNIGRYTLFPVTNAKNVKLQEYITEGIDEKTTKKIFFEKWDQFGEAEKKQKEKNKEFLTGITVYTREQKACAPTTFARHFGHEQADIRGKGIGGDDKHLIQAILKDSSGITYNNLGFIYDLKTRQVKTGLALLPPTEFVDKNSTTKVYDNLDNLIAALEKKKYSDITYGYVNLSYPQDLTQNKALANFIIWTLKEGQKYNHEFGFLDLEDDVLNKQIGIVSIVE